PQQRLEQCGPLELLAEQGLTLPDRGRDERLSHVGERGPPVDHLDEPENLGVLEGGEDLVDLEVEVARQQGDVLGALVRIEEDKETEHLGRTALRVTGCHGGPYGGITIL